MKAFLERIAYILLALIMVIMIGTFSFSYLQGLSLFDAFYFTVITVATVGYGDVYPTTTASKVLAIFIILVGVAAFTGLVVTSVQFIGDQRSIKPRRNRQNMLIELYFSEIGTNLLKMFTAADPGLDKIRREIEYDASNPDATLTQIKQTLLRHPLKIFPERLKLQPLKEILEDKAGFLIMLLENANLIENEASTDLIRATFHLRQELRVRTDLTNLTTSDMEHLCFDSKRVYECAVPLWINHAEYLKECYPYLYSLTLRINPFSEKVSAEMR